MQIIGGARSWIYRYTHHGARKRMGLGSHPAVRVAAAREAARAALTLRNSGIDPVQSRAPEDEAARLAASY
ncbi:MAG: Arm DNA-binding domain-containing protein [Comamonas sp.]|uniref:Arm DNA-binding domain-containing protein n=1 Tax=Comamonas sp. TaxID=34028 RepID=UPI003D0B9A76